MEKKKIKNRSMEKTTKKKIKKKETLLIKANSILELREHRKKLIKEIEKKDAGKKNSPENEMSAKENLTNILMVIIERLAVLETEYGDDLLKLKGKTKGSDEYKEIVSGLKMKWSGRGRYFDRADEVLILHSLVRSWADKETLPMASYKAGVGLSSLNKYLKDNPSVRVLRSELNGKTIKKKAEEVLNGGLDYLKENSDTSNTVTQALNVLKSVAPNEYSSGRTQVENEVDVKVVVDEKKKKRVRELWEDEE